MQATRTQCAPVRTLEDEENGGAPAGLHVLGELTQMAGRALAHRVREIGSIVRINEMAVLHLYQVILRTAAQQQVDA